MRILFPLVAILVANIFVTVNSYRMPAPYVELLIPRGFRVSIPDGPGIELFAFHGNINEPLNGVDAGEYSQDIHTQNRGRWTYKNPTANLQPGDTLFFWTYVIVDGRGYQKLFQRFYVPGNCPRVFDDPYSRRR